MASTKAGGSAKNLNTSNPKYLGVKLADGAKARPGMVIVRQRGTKIEAGKNVAVGRDHTLFSLATGTVAFRTRRKTTFYNSASIVIENFPNVSPAEMGTSKVPNSLMGFSSLITSSGRSMCACSLAACAISPAPIAL